MSNVLLVIIVVAVAVLLLRKPLSSGSGQFSYRRKPYLLSKAERSFYGVFSQVVIFESPRSGFWKRVHRSILLLGWEMGDQTPVPAAAVVVDGEWGELVCGKVSGIRV